MKIALIGYGKMGHAIEEVALRHGHQIVLKIDVDNRQDLNATQLSKADVAIEFTGPESAFENVTTALQSRVPVVCGSTGWTQRLDEVKKLCTETNGAFLYSSNFSVGVNIFFALNRKLAELMAAHPEYSITLNEIHHTQKKDAPSGTAISLAQQVISAIPRKKSWVNHPSDQPEELEIISERINATPGTHRVTYSSAIDRIDIIHTAHSRMGFAGGAVIAAEFLKDRKGFFSMNDVLGI